MSDPLRLWSVTSILKLGLGTSDALVNWAVRTTATYALENAAALTALYKADPDGAIKTAVDARYRKSGAAMARGTNLHKAAEQLALGVQPEVDGQALPYVEQYRRFLEEHQPVFLMSEAPVYAPSQHYAGTLDAVVELGGKRLVADVKTTEHAPDSGRSRPPFPEAALQLCAYSRAEYVGVLSEQRYASGKRYYLFDPSAPHEVMPTVDGAIVVCVSPFDYTVTPVRVDDEVYRCFLAAREAARWQVDVSRRVFGPQISPTVKEVAA